MKTAVNIAFGKRVAELRKDAGYSQEQFAFKCDVDRTYIGTIERGEKSPTLNTIVKKPIACEQEATCPLASFAFLVGFDEVSEGSVRGE